MLTKLISLVLVAGSLAAGAVAASTAYLPRLSAVPRVGDDPANALVLAAPAGLAVDEDGALQEPRAPLVTPGTPLTDEVLEALEQADPPVDRVKVKQFAFGRWDLWWLFGLSLLGLGAGAALVRLDARRQLAAIAPAVGAGGQGSAVAAALGPRETLVVAYRRLQALHAAPHAAGATARRNRIIAELDAVRAECLEPFVDMRPRIVAAAGMSGYARVMDAFAAAERSFNRAWSAAADGYPAEAEESLGAGLVLLEEAVDRAPK